MNPNIDILARTLLGEAEQGDIDDVKAIAAVVMNRVAYPNWPGSVQAVCLQPWQFSCWNQGDPNRTRILAAAYGEPWFDKCIDIAKKAVTGTIEDPTNGATHYYATWMKAPPKWARGHIETYSTPAGGYTHLFFNDIDTKPPQTAKESLDQERPVSSTRTVKGSAVAATGTAVSAVAETLADTADQIGETGRTIIDYAPFVGLALVLVGLGVVLYARWDDRREGKR